MSAEDDRRSEDRIDVRFDVDYRAEDTFLYAQARDLSTMGIFLQTTKPAPNGTVIELRFSTIATDEESSRDVVVKGQVMWRKDDHDGGHPGMGVRFIDVDTITRSRIIDMVETLTLVGPPPESKPPR